MQGCTILIVDDEQEIADLARIYLQNEGFVVHQAFDGLDALQKLKELDVHLVVLDIMMPRMDGLEVCRRIREKGNIPILMLSAKSEDMDKVLGLSTGADDYMTKPFHPMELVARVKSQLRRYLYLNEAPPERTEDDGTIRVQSLALNPDRRDVSVNGDAIHFTRTEFDIVHLLARHPGRVFSAEEIFERVWKEKYYDSHNTVMVHIRKVREKIEKASGETQLIKTVWGVGYKIDT